MHENTINRVFDISTLIDGNFERDIWKMDTSHISILKKFILNSKEPKIILKEVDENRYRFFNPSLIKNERDPGYSQGAITQYIRILCFYNLISFKDIIALGCKNWKCVMQKMMEGKINLKDFNKTPESYLIENFKNITESIKKQINSENKIIRENAIRILSTMEVFINYKNSDYSREIKIDNFNEFLREYPFHIKNPKVNGDPHGYIEELNNWMKLFDYCEQILEDILGLRKEDEKVNDEVFGKIDFTGYGYIGEYLFNEYLNSKKEEHEWVSIKDKYSPYDFKVGEICIEVKTPTNKRNKVSFNLSWNEYVHHQSRKEKYKIYYIDGVYNLDVKKLLLEGIRDFEKLVSENQIAFKEISYKELREYRLAPKGYWVSEK